MLGLVYVILAVLVGFVFTEIFFPQLKNGAETDLYGNSIGLSSGLVIFPASFVTGIIFMSWVSYILACVFASSGEPLLIADEITMIAAVVISGAGLFFIFHKNRISLKKLFTGWTSAEKALFLLLAVFFAWLVGMSFFVAHGKLYVGLTVFSDFTPHVSMIRSFSVGGNFPTQYSVCAGSDVKYHFMYEFLAGNLEYLGLRLDHAFNLPSLLSVLSMFSLFYVLACRITGKRSAGIIACVLLLFRSSFSLVYYIAGFAKGTNVFEQLASNSAFIGSTPNEDWGLWNLNVYLNQRHLPLGLCVLLIMLLIFLPRMYEGFVGMSEAGRGVKSYIKGSLACSEGWIPGNVLCAVGAGLLLGGLGFFNGAVFIATVILLFFMAVVSHRRLEFVITAAIAGILALIQNAVFVDGSSIGMSLRYGFLSENGTFASSVYYLVRLTGFLLFVVLAYFAFTDWQKRWMIICSSMLILFAFYISLTPDIAVNHKYIMIAVMLFDIFAADALTVMFSHSRYFVKAIACLLLLVMISTGVYDTYIITVRNNPRYAMVNDPDAPIIRWITANCTSDDLFLTSNYYLSNSSTGSEVLLSGAMIYNAWQYFGWSAGYDTAARDAVVKQVYGGTDIDTVRAVLSREGIDYIIIDVSNRRSSDYTLNEELFVDNFDAVYSEGTGENAVTVYKVAR